MRKFPGLKNPDSLTCGEILCFKNYVLTLKSCWLFNNDEILSLNVKLRRNSSTCASLKALCITVNAVLL